MSADVISPLRPSDPTGIGRYRLLGRLGAGGMGLVYLGRSPGGRHVAVKVVQPSYLDDPVFRRRFRREVAATRRVSTRWITPVVDADPEAEAPWLATEYVVGPSVQQAVAAQGSLPERTVRFLGARLAKALEEVHGAGLVHRDVKPANVLLAHDGPRLIDFGIARIFDRSVLTATGAVIGTPGYAAPEQLTGMGPPGSADGSGPPSDVFSLGAVLAFACTGRRPFGEGALAGTLYRVVHEPPDLDGVPRELRTVLDAALAKTPADRPEAAELRTALEGRPPTPEGEWLPGPIVRLIAERASALIALDGADPDDEPGPSPSQQPSDDRPPEDRSRAGTGNGAGPSPGPSPATGDEPTVVRTPGAGDEPTVVYEPGAGDRPGSRDEPGTDRSHPGVVDRSASRPGPSPKRPGRSRGRSTPLPRRTLIVGGGAVLALAAAAWADRFRDAEQDAEPELARYTIGLHADLSGDAPAIGRAQERGARLAVERFNAQQSKPFELRLRVEDDRGEEGNARAVARRYVGYRDVLAVIGPTWDSTALAAADTYQEAAMPTLVISAGTGDLSARLARSQVRITPYDTAQAQEIVRWLLEEGVGTVGIADDGTADSRALANRVRAGLGDQVDVWYVEETHPYDALVRRVSAMDAVVFLGSPHDAAKLSRELTRVGYTGVRIGSDQVWDPAFPKLAGDGAEGWLLASFVTDPAAAPDTSGFAADHRRRYDAPAAPYAAEAFDAVSLVIKALTNRDDTEVTRSSLVRLLRETRLDGITRQLAFAPEDGDYRGAGTFLYRVTDGRLRWLGSMADLAGESPGEHQGS